MRKLRSASTGTLTLVIPLVAALLGGALAAAPPAEDSETALAKKTQNPVADLISISVPFQNNFNFGTGPEDRTVWVLNVQPAFQGSG
jgi:hypothetical protein